MSDRPEKITFGEMRRAKACRDNERVGAAGLRWSLTI
jgi:hypothetical protein